MILPGVTFRQQQFVDKLEKHIGQSVKFIDTKNGNGIRDAILKRIGRNQYNGKLAFEVLDIKTNEQFVIEYDDDNAFDVVPLA